MLAVHGEDARIEKGLGDLRIDCLRHESTTFFVVFYLLHIGQECRALESRVVVTWYLQGGGGGGGGGPGGWGFFGEVVYF